MDSSSTRNIECLFICQNEVDQRLTAVNIRHKKCHTQIPLVEKCLNPPIKNSMVGSCCLSRRLPWHCLPLCEQGAPFFHNHRHSHSKDRQFFLNCLKHATTVFQCQLEYKSRLPYPPTNLTYLYERKIDKSTKNRTTVVTVKWRKSQSADRYFVYYRRIKPPPPGPSSGDWTRIDDVRDSQTNLHNLAPSSIYTLIVLAANPLGHSYSSRPIELSIS
uniref:Fibronectin type-III domain-containing protein n=1 Tax=Romanomermis culicivorax TaxID=13658 RepID=A0A915IJ00_ROMCU